MKNLKNLMFALLLLTGTSIFAQTIEGVVQDETGPLPGATVVEKGTSNGVTTDFDGKFSLNLKSTKGTIVISFVGYGKKETPFNINVSDVFDAGNLNLIVDENVLDEVVVTGVVDFAKERETPVAVSTIRAIEIQENLGTQELVEVLNLTPSVYATKQGGGFGDSRINIRGFDQRNTAVMINGMPVNDMESGWVYWSNWAGLADVTSAMQVQRGLGSSKLAISSVGGTINVLTKTSTARQGGSASFTFGNDGYNKEAVSYSTGLMENGFSTSVLLSHFSGDGYVDGTKGDGWNYFIGMGYEINDKHSVMFTFTGAPQWHHQRSRETEISTFQKYSDNDDPNVKYNPEWGYLNGKEYSFRKNFYHKPIMSLNWDWSFNDRSSLSSVFYASWGRGGGTGEIGRINGTRQYALPRTADGLNRLDDIVAWNSGKPVPDFANPKYHQPEQRTPFNGAFSNTGNNGHPSSVGGEGKYGSDNGISRRASMNSHDWYGAVINFNHIINDNWNFDVGTDLRTYTGYHFRVMNDDLGADNYIDYDNLNNPNPANGNIVDPSQYEEAKASWNPWQNIKDMEKIDYYNDGKVKWAGLFGQVEYKNDNISAFLQSSISNQSFQRIEHFREVPPNQESEKSSLTGGSVKGGVNWNINENHNVFFNTGYYAKQPLFNAVFINFGNTLNPDLTNEKIFGLEAGYGYRSAKLSANVNVYRTSWADRFISKGVTFTVGDEELRGTANYKGVKEVHSGLEIDMKYRATDNLRFNGMMSVGNWEYSGDVEADVYDNDQEYIGTSTLYLDNVKVGDAAQFTAAIGASYNFLKNFRVGANWRYAGNLYADINPVDFRTEGNESLELPSFNLFDARLSYNWRFGDGMGLEFSTHMNNIFNTIYMSESATNVKKTDKTNPRDPDSPTYEEAGRLYNGIANGNRVYFGWGRTWNASVRFRF